MLEKASRGRPLDIVTPGLPGPAPRATAPPHAHIVWRAHGSVAVHDEGRRRSRASERCGGAAATRARGGPRGACHRRAHLWLLAQPWSSGCQAARARAPSGCVPRGGDSGGRTAAETPAM
ncbi:hypothetical protein SEVIR_6G098900v4 [Setaria viridis]|uniref:Uncharacterized protein n=1 Tax=Setaria viridis TaxID=4556 RepID=A0A4U6U545_SETVI|nr:hypothetical protein SEVIR_6G098900v2 [Setaria viridis]